MATKATTFLSLPKIKEYITVANANAAKDAVLERIADGVSERIERMTGRTFVNRTIVELINPRGGIISSGSRQGWPFDPAASSVFLRTLPAASVESVRIRPNLQSGWETIGPSGFTLDTFIGQLYLINRAFYSGPLTAEITYTAGYGAQDAATLPSDAVQCFLDYTVFCWKRNEAGMIMAGSQSFGAGSITVVPEPPKDLRDAILTLRKLRGIGLG